MEPQPMPSARQITLCQRSNGRPGAGLGKTTGWIHRAAIKTAGVETLTGCSYVRIDDDGLHLDQDGRRRVLAVDNVVICAGQESQRDLYDPLLQAGVKVHIIGGAHEAGELDAKRAIAQGVQVAASL
jgi:2,4-dienoyl-CoA reductase (NADPH2)